ncbi:MAG: hypothetical protein LBM77_08255 [Spirochaetaceae bacterium]|jgi:hypothetical protein|nr:hypothetical protein [Spirochaetaceae bacterium]
MSSVKSLLIDWCAYCSNHTSKYRIKLVDDIPAMIEAKTIYIVGNKLFPQYAIFNCPCGCGKQIELCLNPKDNPSWKIKWHLNGTISLYPSINRFIGCRSHFWFLKSEIV